MSDRPAEQDLDPGETQEWLESIDSVLKAHGPERAHFLLEQLIDHTRRSGAYLPFKPNTAYLNTISTGQQPDYPGNRELERRIEAYIRWNATAMVVQANRISSEYGGHIASYASAATLYEVGFNHFWRAPTADHPGDMIFFQGHAAPGIYARAYLEGRLTEDQLRHFRQEVAGDGLSSYPHPWLMPDFWQFPTVSMGLGPMQARFQRYLEHRGLVPQSDRKIWAFLGDGEMDEPESMGAITMPVREKLDNLVFVINCNLQRLDGPVRGNGKIVQELEAAFLGAGWNVIKVLWGSRWDPLLAKDNQGLLRRVMEECVDGEYQNFKAKGGAYTREHFFGKYPETRAMVANLSDEEIWRLNRGGHDPRKVYAAYAAAMAHRGQPTLILAKTVKGFGMGKAGEGQMGTHQQKKLSDEDLQAFRDRFNIGKHIVPIVPDEARTFGMEGLFRQVGIYSSVGQLYTSQDADQLMSYREDKKGQILEEGINEAGALCSWIAAGTAYANHGINMVPFYIFYSMFGFQRVGDFIWAAGDLQTRGFLLGATAGRTTLAGEGLQHQDGSSQLLSSLVPNCRSYDPTYAYELAVIIHDGLRRMYTEGENVFYYVTVMNENYAMPAMPADAAAGILKGLYRRVQIAPKGKVRKGRHATLLGAGTILREVEAAAAMLAEDHGIECNVYSAPSFSELRREALDCERWNMLHPTATPRTPYVATALAGERGPFVAASDYVRNVPDQIRQWVPGRYVVLGTDGYGRSDARAALRHHFEVDRRFIVIATLRALADEGVVPTSEVAEAITRLGIDVAKPNPLHS